MIRRRRELWPAAWMWLLCWLSAFATSSPTAMADDEASAADEIGWGSEPASNTATSSQLGADADAVGWGEDGNDARSERTTEPTRETTQTSEEREVSKFQIQGRLQLRSGLWTRRPHTPVLAQARTALDLNARYSDRGHLGGLAASWRAVVGVHGEYDAAYLIERERYDEATLDAYEWQVYMRETLIGASLGRLTLTFGRQIIPFGQGEVWSLVDLLNPRDLREPGLTNPDDLRLPVLSSRMGLSFGGLNLEAIVLHEANFGLVPSPLAPLSPFRELLLGDPLAGQAFGRKQLSLSQVPAGFQPDRWQYFARAGYAGDSVDIEIYAGSVLDRLGVPQLPTPAEFVRDRLAFKLFHPRYTFIGSAGAWAIGAVLLRYELIAEFNRTLATIAGDAGLLQFGAQRGLVIGGLLGATYFGSQGLNLGVELENAKLVRRRAAPGPDAELLWPIERINAAVRVTQDLFRDAVRLSLLAGLVGLDEFNGAFVRAELRYTMTDGLRIDAGYVLYLASTSFGPFFGFDKNDRAQLTLQWDFSAR